MSQLHLYNSWRINCSCIHPAAAALQTVQSRKPVQVLHWVNTLYTVQNICLLSITSVFCGRVERLGRTCVFLKEECCLELETPLGTFSWAAADCRLGTNPRCRAVLQPGDKYCLSVWNVSMWIYSRTLLVDNTDILVLNYISISTCWSLFTLLYTLLLQHTCRGDRAQSPNVSEVWRLIGDLAANTLASRKHVSTDQS